MSKAIHKYSALVIASVAVIGISATGTDFVVSNVADAQTAATEAVQASKRIEAVEVNVARLRETQDELRDDLEAILSILEEMQRTRPPAPPPASSLSQSELPAS